MTVTGTEQRVYGTLTGGCIIDLHRFALVSGSTTLSPPEASTVTYADTTPYKQCGYKYAGYLTLFLSISGSSVYAAVEVRICKNDPKRIVIETYGEVAKTVTGGMSLWFNKGTDKHFPTRDDFPETGSSNVNYINDATGKYYIWNETLYEEGSCWVKLNSTTSGVKMPYATTSYTFKESKRNGSTTIDCCKKCPSCGCKACNITGLSLSYISPAVVEPTPLQWDANGRWTHLYPSFVETLSDTVTKYVYTTFEGMVYQVIRTINWDQSTNITTTIFEASVVSAWWYYQCHFELRWGVGSSDATPGGINPGREVGGDPPLIYIVNPYYGSTTGEILIGTDVRSGYSGTVTPSSTSSYGYTNNGDYTAFFASQKSFIEYKLKCDSLQFWIGDTGSHESQNKLYYTDMDTGEVHLLGTLEPGQATGTITTSFPFDYLKNCMTFTCNTNCCEYVTITPSNGKTIQEVNQMCPIVGKKLTIYGSVFNTLTGIISEITPTTNVIKMDRTSLTSTIGNLQSTLTYDSFTYECDIAYTNRTRYAYMQGTFPFPGFSFPLHPEIVFMSFDFDWDILVTHTPTGTTFHQTVYASMPYNDYVEIQSWYVTLSTYMSSDLQYNAPNLAQFPLSGFQSGKIAIGVPTTDGSYYGGSQTIVLNLRLHNIYATPHNYTGHLTFNMTNIKYYNCRGEEIKSGDKCFPIGSGMTATIGSA